MTADSFNWMFDACPVAREVEIVEHSRAKSYKAATRMQQVDFGLGQFDRFEDHTTIYYRWEVLEDPSSESAQAQAKGLGGSIRPSIENMEEP